MQFTKRKIFKQVAATALSLIIVSLMILPTISRVDASLWDMQEGKDFLKQPFGYDERVDPRGIAIDVVRIFLTFMGLIFTILIILGGYGWMMSRGNEDKVNKAKSQIKAAIIGIVIVMAAYAITEFVFIYLRKEVFSDLY